jgi:hypothetical protein
MTVDGSQGAAEPGPPPVPPEAATAPVLRRRSRRGVAVRIGLLILLAAGGGFLGGLAASDVVSVPDVLRGRATLEAERELELVGLLEDIVRSEAVMLDFNEELERRLAGVTDQATALRIVEEAASDGVGGLEALRPAILERARGDRVSAVRDAYIPHLDAWIDYLAELSVRPGMLFDGAGQQPFILRINITADEFRVALEELLEAGPSPRAAELAERILDDGFRSDGPGPTL